MGEGVHMCALLRINRAFVCLLFAFSCCVAQGQTVPPVQPTGAPVSAPPILSPSELYQQTFNATVTIEKISADGTSAGKSTGFWIGDGRLLTAFSAIDG